MTLAADEFLRRFLLHALPRGFHRIRHYGLLASARRKDHLERARRLLSVAPPPAADPINEPEARPLCPCCGGTMVIIEVFERRRSEEHTSELQSLMRTSYAVFCLKKKHNDINKQET